MCDCERSASENEMRGEGGLKRGMGRCWDVLAWYVILIVLLGMRRQVEARMAGAAQDSLVCHVRGAHHGPVFSSFCCGEASSL